MEQDDVVILRTSDGKDLKVVKKHILLSKTIDDLMLDVDVELDKSQNDNNKPVHCIPLPSIAEKTLVKVIEYCKYHHENPPIPPAPDAIPLKPWEIVGWDAEFLKEFEKEDLYYLIAAANYLKIESLLEVSTKEAANRLKGKTPDEICEYFGCKNDFTEEELEAVRKENPWLQE